MSTVVTVFASPGSRMLQDEGKIGILAGSLLSRLLGYNVLRPARCAASTTSIRAAGR